MGTLSNKLLTDRFGAGDHPRLRVDVAQTGFFSAREARTFYEFTMTDGEERIIKASTPVDIILFAFDAIILSGELKIYTMLDDGAPGGSFSEDLPVFNTNQMASAPGYVPQATLTTGGTYTGGTVFDLLWLKTSNNINKASGIGTRGGDEFGMAAGDYYIKMQATGAVSGVFKALWEERPEGV
jgi:hypothetical protein